ncbi:hypothetical protein AB0F93_03545 [Micromonospora tulbaghiae]|uniref:hypothetical protein n=1 Tax=Micromonospora tulbaghiae TaxID=479978 RepID=UPI00332F6890
MTITAQDAIADLAADATAVREQLLDALGLPDDGHTTAAELAAQLAQQNDQLRTAVRRYAVAGGEALATINRARDAVSRISADLTDLQVDQLLYALDSSQHAHTYGLACPARGCRWPLDSNTGAPPTDALAAWLTRAALNPGSIAGRRRGPSWPAAAEGYADVQESMADWINRAVHAVLATNGQPTCERCCGVIHVDDAYDPPLPGVGLWEHAGECPPLVAPNGCGDCAAAPGARHRYAACPGSVPSLVKEVQTFAS